MTVLLDIQCPYCGQSRHTYDPEEAILEIDELCEHLCTSTCWATEYRVEALYRHPSFDSEAAEDALADLPDWILTDRFPDNLSTPYRTGEGTFYFDEGSQVAFPELLREEPDEYRYRSGIDPVPGSRMSPLSMWLHVATLWSPDPATFAEELCRATLIGD